MSGTFALLKSRNKEEGEAENEQLRRYYSQPQQTVIEQGHRKADSKSKSEWTLSKAGQFSAFRSSLTLPINPHERQQVSSDGGLAGTGLGDAPLGAQN